jgi:N-acetylglucosaminyl-diphospho-decaprenol L-rhamnosyltransferase
MGAASGAGLGVSAVVLTRNRKEVLATVLDRLFEHPVDEVLVVDNGSTDGTVASLRGRTGVRVVEAGRNLGFGARNLGAGAASHELLLMLDDDAYPLPGAVETLANAFAANPRLGAAGGFVRDVAADGRIVRSTEVGTFDWWLRAGRSEAPPDGLPAFSFPEGASMLRRTAYLEAGGFFEPYFLTNSEIDLAARLTGLGWDVRYFPDAPFDHLKALSERLTPDDAIYYRVRNHLWYLWLRFPRGMAARRTVGYLTFDLIDSAYRGVPSAWWRGLRDAWRLRDCVRRERAPLAADALRRAELNRGRMHARLLAEQLARRVRRRG